VGFNLPILQPIYNFNLSLDPRVLLSGTTLSRLHNQVKVNLYGAALVHLRNYPETSCSLAVARSNYGGMNFFLGDVPKALIGDLTLISKPAELNSEGERLPGSSRSEASRS